VTKSHPDHSTPRVIPGSRLRVPWYPHQQDRVDFPHAGITADRTCASASCALGCASMNESPLHVAVVGSGAAGLSAAWLLAGKHRVTLLERDDRLGGHAHTASDGGVSIDTGFIVYNEPCYPNLVRWFDALGVATAPSDMSFAVSRDAGRFEYAGGPPLGLLAQPSLLLRPRYWSMLRGLARFYREARDRIPADSGMTLGTFLQRENYSRAFVDDHLMPFASAVWSSPSSSMLDFPAAAFIRFCDNHGLLQISGRPQWRTVEGGSRAYVDAVELAIGPSACVTGFDVSKISRGGSAIRIEAHDGRNVEADHVVLATHADQALGVLADVDALEQTLLSPFHYEPNVAVLHTDIGYLPRRRRAWCSWNYVEASSTSCDASSHAGGGSAASGSRGKATVSYWMNRLQPLATDTDYIVSLNPEPLPDDEHVVRVAHYEHPVFNAATYAAQQKLWSLQGRRRTWFCGSYFGAGFHEDAVQAGLAVAEQLGGNSRPWELADPSSRIVVQSRDSLARPVAA